MEVSNFEADKQYAKSETNSIHSDVQIETSSNFKSFNEEDFKMNSHEVIDEGSTYKSQGSHHLIQVNDDDEEDVKMDIHEVIEEGSIYDSQGSHQLIHVKEDDVEEKMKENPGEVESSESWSSDFDSSTDWNEIIYYGAILMFIIVLCAMVTQMARRDEKKDVAGGSIKFEEEKRVVEEKETFEEISENQNVVAAEAEEKKRTKDLTKKKARIEDEKLRAAAKQKIHVTEDKTISTKPQEQIYTPQIAEDLEEENSNAEAEENNNAEAEDIDYEEPSQTICVEGRIGYNSAINGIYHKQSTLHEGRVWYKDDVSDWHIRWYPKNGSWHIAKNAINNGGTCNAFVNHDVPAPELISVPWQVYNDDTFVEDINVKTKKIQFEIAKPEKYDRIRVIQSFHTNDDAQKELKVGDILIVKRKSRENNGAITVNSETNSCTWKQNYWILPGNFYKIEIYEEPSQTICVEGRIGLNSPMNGIYHKQSTLHEGRVWYKKDSSDWHLRWYPKDGSWSIDNKAINNEGLCNAFVKHNVPAPELISVPWQVFNDDHKFVEDINVKVKKIQCIPPEVKIIIGFLFWVVLIALHVTAFVVNFTSTSQQPVIYWSMMVAAFQAMFIVEQMFMNGPLRPKTNNPWMGVIYFVWNGFIAVLSFYSMHRETKKNWKHQFEGWWAPAFISSYSALFAFIYPIYFIYKI